MWSLLILNAFILFLIGFIQDVLGAYYLRLVTEQRLFLATGISFVHSILGWAIWFWFMYQFQNPQYVMSGADAVILSVGGAVGTFMGLRRPGHVLAKKA